VEVKALDKPKAWRLVEKRNDGALEEIVLSVRGILCAKDLPPMLEKPKWVAN
jgi:hypothetical protein